MGKKAQYLLTAGFLLVLAAGSAVSIRNVIPAAKQKIAEDPEYFAEGGTKLGEDFRTEFTRRRDWINLYGLSQKALGKRILGNQEFAMTEAGILETLTPEYNLDPFIGEIQELKGRLDARGIGLLYVQMPAREPEGSLAPEQLFHSAPSYGYINRGIEGSGIIRLGGEEILSGEGAPTLEELYFKTDLHTTTRGEAWMADKIAKKLEEEFGVSIDKYIGKDGVEYKSHSHEFLGNLAQSVGEYYLGLDVFEERMPAEETSYVMTDMWHTWEERGSYEEILMNGYDDVEGDEKYIYWITNYLKYGIGAYHIENLNSDGPSLLFICDSYCYRTMSYLSLGCSRITVLDPRFFTKRDITIDPLQKMIDENEYDAVVYLHGSFTPMEASMFGRGNLKYK